ncbi:DUF503 domain-containing protein [Bhargavaea cecembensis]|uniref:DUF503 domain-containing protein n=1 Tax=Bhargavaea cecembensis TaxID=394098 RepID=UPI00059003C7|nr:DUF503 domain-containing protein [Bhargavaea cecembensis]
MIILAECEFYLYDTHSLKEKRAILQRMITRVRQQYNVSIAETGHQDLWQRAGISVVAVASSRTSAEREIDRVLNFLMSHSGWEMTESIKQDL